MNHITTVRDVLKNSVQIYPKRTAFVVADKNKELQEVSYERFGRDVDALCFALREKLGLGGKHIGLSGANSYRWCVSYFAVLSGAGVAVPLDKDNSPEETAGLLSFGDVEAVICDSRRAKELYPFVKEKNITLICSEGECEGAESYESLIEYGRLFIEAGGRVNYPIDENALAVLIFTSGTTGVSKGVMLTNRNLISDMKAVSSNVSLSYEDRSLSLLPLHHTYEAMALLMVIKSGATVSFASSYKNLVADFRLYKPTVLVCVPLILEKLNRRIEKEIERRGKTGKSRLVSIMSGVVSDDAKRKLFSSVHESFGGRLRKIIVGAAPIQKSTVEAFETYGIPIIIGYGLTECSPIVICNSDIDRKSDSIGKPLNSVEVKIIDTDEKGVGEIAVKGPMVMSGYYKNDEATEAAIENGWLKTGDLGYADRHGYYRITGRRKNVIVTSGGKNIYPEEIEHYLLKSPLVAECLVYAKRDKEITAEIYPDEGEMLRKSKKEILGEGDKELYIEAVVKTVNKKLPPYKRIKTYIIRDTEFEKTATHKIKR